MIALDTNTLVYLLISSQPEHARAAHWLSQGGESVCTTGTNVGEFLRLVTHPRLFPRPLTMPKAIDLFGAFATDFRVSVMPESEEWWSDLSGLDQDIPYLRGNDVFDARVALCLRYNGVKRIATLDRGFRRFPFLEVIQY
jgi:toxin-antitoxin system PIN domain toxin